MALRWSGRQAGAKPAIPVTIYAAPSRMALAASMAAWTIS